MTSRTAGSLRDKVALQRRGEDANGDRLGPWETVVDRSAEIINLRGGEPVMAQRLQGEQPVVIAVYACSVTRQIDNSWRAINARTQQVYDIASAPESEDRVWIEMLATAKAGEVSDG